MPHLMSCKLRLINFACVPSIFCIQSKIKLLKKSNRLRKRVSILFEISKKKLSIEFDSWDLFLFKRFTLNPSNENIVSEKLILIMTMMMMMTGNHRPRLENWVIKVKNVSKFRIDASKLNLNDIRARSSKKLKVQIDAFQLGTKIEVKDWENGEMSRLFEKGLNMTVFLKILENL